MSAREQSRGEYRPGYGDLLYREENSVRGVRRRTVRWAVLVVLALVVLAAAILWIFETMGPGDGVPPWWFYVPFLSSWLVLLWGFFEFISLMTAWRHVGWQVEIYEHGVVVLRFGTIRQAMPYSGGVLDLGRTLFTSPRPDIGPGRLTASWKGELVEASSKIKMAARAELLRETLAQLRGGSTVAFPGLRDGMPGITLAPDLLVLPDGREYEVSWMWIQYYISGDSGYEVTRDSARATGFNILTDDDEQGFGTEGGYGVRGLKRRSPNLDVVRETLHVLVDPDGHRRLHRGRPDDRELESPK